MLACPQVSSPILQGTLAAANYWGWIKWKQNSSQSLRRDVLTHSKESICVHFSSFAFSRLGIAGMGQTCPTNTADDGSPLLRSHSSYYKRIIELLQWEKTSKVLKSHQEPSTAMSNNAPRCYMYVFSEHFQKWWFHQLTGSVFHCLVTPSMKKFFPISHLTLPWKNLRPKISVCSVQGQC